MGVNEKMLQENVISFPNNEKQYKKRQKYFQEEITRHVSTNEQEIIALEKSFLRHVELLKQYVKWRGSVMESLGVKSSAVDLCAKELDRLKDFRSPLDF